MARFVIDASATLPWCLKDEETAWTIDLLRRLTTGDQIVVPAHWPIEVANALLMATRRKRIPEGRAVLFLDELAMLPITVEPALTFTQVRAVYDLCERHNLTFYDGTISNSQDASACPSPRWTTPSSGPLHRKASSPSTNDVGAPPSARPRA